MDKELIEQMEQSYVDNLNSLVSDGSIQDYSIKQIQVSDGEVMFEVSIVPTHGTRRIKSNFTVTRDGVRFDDEKK